VITLIFFFDTELSLVPHYFIIEKVVVHYFSY